ncbi:MAG: signal peptidase I [Clostridia bacterium]|nr:signal peptidase I [Clostridiales bacterium]MDD7165524.1 signal peptidase I [Clostridia bacterium]MDY2901058.1 signal peptidase I [Christensenellaceae bacterium]
MENDIKRIEKFKINDRLIGAPKEKVFSFADVVLIVLIVVMLAFSVVQRVWISPVNIDGNSMNKTIDDGDWLVMNKLAKPDYGDVVVIEISGKINYIKRVIGLPGDTIYINDDVVYRKKKGETDFTPLDEPYAYYSSAKKSEKYAAVVIPEGKIFVLGDNRYESKDSRSPDIGTRNVSAVIGVVPDWAIKRKSSITSYYNTVMKIDNFILGLFGAKADNGRNK